MIKLHMKDGKIFTVDKEDSRYWHCKNTSFMKSNANIEKVEKVRPKSKEQEE